MEGGKFKCVLPDITAF